LANAYAQTLGTIFSSGGEKPYEVEIFVAEVADEPADDQVYRLTYDGSVADEHGFAVMGGSTERSTAYLAEHYVEGLDQNAAIRLAVAALAHDSEPTREIAATQIEAAVLDRTRTLSRKFRRLPAQTVRESLASG
jgi:proteasome alpha subunit